MATADSLAPDPEEDSTASATNAGAAAKPSDDQLDLLEPEELREQYKHQLNHTIQAYSAPYVFVGEALQNALDATIQAQRSEGSTERRIQLHIDFDNRQVRVTDQGAGFPDQPGLLYLGGSRKQGVEGVAGQVGVGMKVILFSTAYFELRSNNGSAAHRISLVDAYRFLEQPAPTLRTRSVIHHRNCSTRWSGGSACRCSITTARM